MANIESSSQQGSTPLAVAHAADAYHRYPGELVTFYTRVTTQAALPGYTLRTSLPEGLVLESYTAAAVEGLVSPEIERTTRRQYLVWPVGQAVKAGSQHEYRLSARVEGTPEDLMLESQAVVTTRLNGGETPASQETVTVTVVSQADYLRYLPALYREDDLMNRFLMFFESFWAPVERQIDTISLYFDPELTPSDFLPWLASWIDLVLDERWPEERRRALLKAAALLYRKRGTRQGLVEHLEIYTGQKPRIIEHRAGNFVVGDQARLGPGIALGRDNLPHTFTVVMSLPPVDLPPGADQEEQHRQEQWRQRTIEAIIEAGKPAHTRYTLRLEQL